MDLKKVLFICHGNINRSPAAELVWKKLGISNNVKSAGFSDSTNKSISKKMRSVLNKEGFKKELINKHKSQTINQELMDWATTVFCMTPGHVKKLVQIFPKCRDKIHLLPKSINKERISDPGFSSNIADFEKAFQDIQKSISKIRKGLKVIAIGGEPATGKTALVSKIISEHKFKKCKYKKILNYLKSNNIIILGKYEGGKFDGTDRLSMAVQPVAQNFLTENANENYIVIFEGDRLFNKKFLEFSSNQFETHIIILSTSEKIKTHRHKERKDTQQEKFLKGRKTKMKNIYKSFRILTMKSESEKDLTENHKIIQKIIIGENMEKYQKESERYLKEKKSQSGVLKFMREN